MGNTIGQLAGVAGAAAAGPLGAALGGALGNIVGGLFGGKGKDTRPASTLEEQLKDAGPGVFQWAKEHAPIVFMEWMFKNHPDRFGSISELQAMYSAWAFGFNGSIVNPDNAFFGGMGLTPAYQAMGIDYPATIAKARSSGGYPANLNRARDSGLVVMLPGSGSAAVPLPAVNELKRVNEQGANTPAEKRMEANVQKASGEGFSLGNVLLIAVLLAVLLMLFR